MLDGAKRTVFFTENFHKFAWSKRNSKKIKKDFYLKDIVEIKTGKNTKGFKRFKRANPRFCFSILMKDRTIDIECLNSRDYKALGIGFKFMNKMYKTFLNNLTASCERLIKTIISEINNSLPKFVYEDPIPKRAYELIGREDIYMNKQLYPRVKNHTKRHGHTKSISRSSNLFGTPSFISGTPNSMLDDTRQYDSKYLSPIFDSKFQIDF